MTEENGNGWKSQQISRWYTTGIHESICVQPIHSSVLLFRGNIGENPHFNAGAVYWYHRLHIRMFQLRFRVATKKSLPESYRPKGLQSPRPLQRLEHIDSTPGDASSARQRGTCKNAASPRRRRAIDICPFWSVPVVGLSL